VSFVQGEVTAIDTGPRAVVLADGRVLAGDALVVAPGIGFRWGAVRG
jgi:NADPH-dependent 2,4-dienoyl-CoA reductase/sulfur reductase-like enzyme